MTFPNQRISFPVTDDSLLFGACDGCHFHMPPRTSPARYCLSPATDRMQIHHLIDTCLHRIDPLEPVPQIVANTLTERTPKPCPPKTTA